ncbi:hypothetical protein BH09PSE4_BH09PSE4_03280 [soil metagenome]
MDLSFLRFERDAQVTILPSDLAVLFVGVGARQAASPTALLAARLARTPRTYSLFAPLSGAFNDAMAGMLTQWKAE